MSSSWMLRIVRWLLAVMSIVCVFSVVYHLYNQQYETETAIYATADESVAFQGCMCGMKHPAPIPVRGRSVTRFPMGESWAWTP